MLTTLFVILIIIAAIVLGFFVLIQNPKGGGLAGTFGGVSSQFMGVKQTNDVLEKGTWIFATVIGLLSLFATFFISGSQAGGAQRLQDISTQPVQQAQPQPQQGGAPAVPFNGGTQAQPGTQAAPVQTAPLPSAAQPDSGKK
ncbi:preprotein translocase subunit SecG [Niabella ginsenosidivorans]|uniref:Protein-export membrane protein SecG n=1 Tax=Niabella ginsenosidivorans TaxID=1176587 RepID=A0A1A9I1Y2_9BACT|nr:preprotein translocase subunit SecG [Niabella ginsenosidivorans]ANH80702.1 preprotein translocase subunit SecG [Niabella ginsenosidivorans]